ncbi:DNA polymerase III subunit delta [Natronospira bacteriovora]|uniref:DNA polymerase III subunit delta n=1 Tax=Natronospira bacteriovora TaxID=3069753 RepID=A0ABU0W7N0_9GAMM|nr:DNA polymerase III subunit delta [Natronospira sp. AB-CW4]MDQ2069947.1 DNA polymerase III subunit delta [Natronospira sp. AB-CW4]
MKIRPEQLDAHLQKGLAPLYLLAGDEPLLLDEAAASIRRRVREAGAEERIALVAEKDFDWSRLTEEAASLSLFASKRLMELRLPGGKPGQEGAKVLTQWAERPPEDTTLVVISGKLDRGSRNAKWVKALEQAGAMVEFWPIPRHQLPAWVQKRMAASGLSVSREAARFIAERVEGNLLAAAQEVEKLRLLLGEGQVSDSDVQSAVVDSARFDPFQLADAALNGETARAVRILEGLHGEGVEPPLLVWVLAREVRSLADMATGMAQGKRMEDVTRRVWASRRSLVEKALQRHPAERWLALLEEAGRIDAIAKGAAPGNAWDALQRLVMAMASVKAGRRLGLVA